MTLALIWYGDGVAREGFEETVREMMRENMVVISIDGKVFKKMKKLEVNPTRLVAVFSCFILALRCDKMLEHMFHCRRFEMWTSKLEVGNLVAQSCSAIRSLFFVAFSSTRL